MHELWHLKCAMAHPKACRMAWSWYLPTKPLQEEQIKAMDALYNTENNSEENSREENNNTGSNSEANGNAENSNADNSINLI